MKIRDPAGREYLVLALVVSVPSPAAGGPAVTMTLPIAPTTKFDVVLGDGFDITQVPLEGDPVST